MARHLAYGLGGHLVLAHVLEALPVPGVSKPDRERAERYLATVAARIAGNGAAPVNSRVLMGEPADALLALSREEPNTLFVMSSHGRGGVGRLIFGSVSDQVIRGATVPVLIVRAPLIGGDRLRHVLVPLDGSPLAEAALPLAVEIARATGATLGLVRVADVNPTSPLAGLAGPLVAPDDELFWEMTEQLRDEARAYLDSVVQGLRGSGVRVGWEVRLGRPADELIRAAQTTGADLIVMSTHGRGGVERWAFGSVTDEVLRSRATSVLVVPQRAARANGVAPEHAGVAHTTLHHA